MKESRTVKPTLSKHFEKWENLWLKVRQKLPLEKQDEFLHGLDGQLDNFYSTYITKWAGIMERDAERDGSGESDENNAAAVQDAMEGLADAERKDDSGT